MSWVHQRWSLATLLLLGFCSGSGYSVDASQTQTHTHTKHMAAVSHAHARSSFTHTCKCFLQKQKCHQNIVSRCMLIPMKRTRTRKVCQSVSESKPLGDPSSPGVEFLPLLFVLHELLLHLLHRALSRCPLFFWEDVGKSKCLAHRLMRRQRQKAQREKI